jgi:hypothetical protein
MKLSLVTAIGCCTVLGFVLARESSGEQQPKIMASTLTQDMRRLWSDHVIWTREYIIAAASAADQQAAANRLMKNQEDIGTAVTGY